MRLYPCHQMGWKKTSLSGISNPVATMMRRRMKNKRKVVIKAIAQREHSPIIWNGLILLVKPATKIKIAKKYSLMKGCEVLDP